MSSTSNIDIKKLFEEKASLLRSNTQLKLNSTQKLKFYGLYKVATTGKFSEENKLKAGFFDFETKYKNEAWEKCSIYSQEEAMLLYINFYNELTGEKKIEISNIENNNNSIKNIENKKISLDNIILNIPENFESQSLYSSTSKRTQEELKNFMEKQSEEIKKFQLLKDEFYQGEMFTEEKLKEFENKNKINLLTFRDTLKQTVLHVAVDAINFSAVDSIIKMNYAQELIDVQDNVGMTPLHIAAINFDVHIYDLLVLQKPDFKIRDNEGKTCIDYLKENEDVQVPKKYLREDGKDEE